MAEGLAKLADDAEAKLTYTRDVLNGKREDRAVHIKKLQAEIDGIYAAVDFTAPCGPPCEC